MEQTKEIVLKVKFTAKHLFLLIAIALFAWRPGVLNSAQSMTMTSYYPAPYGGYNKLLTTGHTYLGDTYGAVVRVARNYGVVCLGSTNSSDGGYCTNSDTGKNATIYQMGSAYFGYPRSGSASGTTYTYGSTYLSHYNGIAYFGLSKSEPTYSSYTTGYYGYGAHSNVPFSTNKWIYVGPNGNYYTYNSPRQVQSNSSSISEARAGVLVNAGSVQTAAGVVVMKGMKTVSLSVLDNSAILSAGLNTPLQITAGDQPLISLDNSVAQQIILEKNTRIRGHIYLGSEDNTRGVKDDSSTQANPYKQNTSKIYNLCYYQPFGYSSGQSRCASNYMPVGFLPNNLHSNASTSNDPVIGVFNFTSGRDKHRAYNTGTNSMYFAQDVRATAAGFMVCCAMDIPIQYLPSAQTGY